MTGAPTKLTREVHDALVEVFSAGGTKVTAAEKVGVDERTINNWLRWGEHGLREGKANSYVELFLAVRRAHAERELRLLAMAEAGDEPGVSNGPAKCAQWALERTFGSKYAARQVIKVEDALQKLLDDVERVCAGKDCGCLEAIWAAIAGADGTGAPRGSTGEEEQPTTH